MGGLDKLNVRQSAVVNEGAPTALQTANLGLRTRDAEEGEEINPPRSTASPSARTRGRASARRTPTASATSAAPAAISWPSTATRSRRAAASASTTSRSPRRSRSSGPRRSSLLPRRARPGPPPHRRHARHGDRHAEGARSSGSADGRNIFRWRNRIIAIPNTLVARASRATTTTASTASPSASRASTRWPPSRRRSRASSRRTTGSRRTSASTTSARGSKQAAQPGRRLRHHLPALGVPVADRRRHRQRQHPDGDAQGAHPRGRRQDGDRRAGPRDLQGVHDGGAAPDGHGLPRRARHRRRVFEDHHRLDRRPAAHRPEELRLRVPARRVFGFLFALFPAWKASRLSPMEALRYE